MSFCSWFKGLLGFNQKTGQLSAPTPKEERFCKDCKHVELSSLGPRHYRCKKAAARTDVVSGEKELYHSLQFGARILSLFG